MKKKRQFTGVAHEFAPGDRIVTSFGLRGRISSVHFGVSYDVRLDDGTVNECLQEDEVSREPKTKRGER